MELCLDAIRAEYSRLGQPIGKYSALTPGQIIAAAAQQAQEWTVSPATGPAPHPQATPAKATAAKSKAAAKVKGKGKTVIAAAAEEERMQSSGW